MITKKFNQKKSASFILLSTQIGFKAIYEHVKFLNFLCFLNDFYTKSPKCH